MAAKLFGFRLLGHPGPPGKQKSDAEGFALGPLGFRV